MLSTNTHGEAASLLWKLWDRSNTSGPEDDPSETHQTGQSTQDDSARIRSMLLLPVPITYTRKVGCQLKVAPELGLWGWGLGKLNAPELFYQTSMDFFLL